MSEYFGSYEGVNVSYVNLLLAKSKEEKLTFCQLYN